MERNILSWNITNWITVLLMVGIGYFVIAGVVSMARSYWSGDDGSTAVPANGQSS